MKWAKGLKIRLDSRQEGLFDVEDGACPLPPRRLEPAPLPW